jgi:hypothetical protein
LLHAARALRRSKGKASPSFSCWPLVKAGVSEQLGHVIDVQCIAHASDGVGRLYGGDVAVAVIIARRSRMKDANGDNLPALKADNHVPIIGGAAIAVVHHVLLLLRVTDARRDAPGRVFFRSLPPLVAE